MAKNITAVDLGRKGGLKGGKSRAASLSPQERSESARKAARARWSLPVATHTGVLPIGDAEIRCYVLENGERILSTRGIMEGLKRTWRGRKYTGTELPVFVEAKNLEPFISKDLDPVLNPVHFRTEKGATAEGFRAEILPTVCEIYLRARDAGALTGPQHRIAQQCETLIRALAKVGINALVDEATGYQEDRDRDALHRLLEKYLAEERLSWAKMFPDEFYKNLYRLRGWKYPTGGGRTPFVGKLTNQLVYEKLPPGVLGKLRERNPTLPEKKWRKWKHHQFLSEDLGQPDLRDHLLQLIAVMRVSRGWKEFERNFDRAFPGPDGIQGDLLEDLGEG